MKKFLVAVLAAFIFAGCGDDGAGDAAVAYIKALYNGDMKSLEAATYGEMSPLVSQALKLSIGFVKTAVEQQGGVKKVEAIKSEVNGDVAGVWLRTTMNNGKTEDSKDPVTLRKDKDGKWKVVIN